MHGYMGAHPKPTNINPINVTISPAGNNMNRTPTNRIACPKYIIFVSFNFSVKNPLKNLPIDIPI